MYSLLRVSLYNLSLIYQRFTPLGSKNIGIKKFEFVANMIPFKLRLIDLTESYNLQEYIGVRKFEFVAKLVKNFSLT